MWKVSSMEEQRRVIRRISEPPACQSDFLWHGMLFFWETATDSRADMHTSRSTNRAQENHKDSKAEWRKDRPIKKNKKRDMHVKTKMDSSQRETHMQADHQLAHSSKRQWNCFFWMMLTIFPSIRTFVQKVTDYDEWTISLRREKSQKKKEYSYVLRNTNIWQPYCRCFSLCWYSQF